MPAFVEVAVNAPLRAGDRVFTFAIPSAMQARLIPGTPVRVPFGTRVVPGFVVGLSPATSRPVKAVSGIDERLPPLPADLVALAWWMADHYVCSVGEAIFAMLPPKVPPSAKDKEPRTPAAPASSSQTQDDPTGVSALLDGHPQVKIAVTGGDARFDAYDAALRWAAGRDCGVILLVPEISQAERMAAWVERRAGGPVGLLHGALPARERWALWRAMDDGEIRVAVGTRVAAFAPVRRLGLIIIDHEEDTSYKEEHVPRYHAARVAEARAGLAGAALIWGTPTPSMEVVREVEEGRASQVGLASGRAGVAVADARADAGPLGGLFGRRLYQALARTLPRGRALLFVPRRGYADFLLCHECGAVPRCPRCGVAMTYHARGTGLRCHLCGTTEPSPETCRTCGGTRVRPHGVGTERVETAARRLFRGTPVLRLDSDVAPEEPAQQKTWQQFARRGGLLIGTQLLVKGVGQVPAAVVGAIGVDAGLHLPDFRAGERTYQVLAQLAALAQREMIVQTFSPSHPALVALARQDTSKFYRDELAARQRFGYPPYVPLINLVVTGTDRAAVREAADRIASALANDGEVLGPSPAPLSRIRGRHRWQVLVKEREPMRTRSALRLLLSTMPLPRAVRLMVDVDPVDLL